MHVDRAGPITDREPVVRTSVSCTNWGTRLCDRSSTAGIGASLMSSIPWLATFGVARQFTKALALIGCFDTDKHGVRALS
jgi:hypothetical protein